MTRRVRAVRPSRLVSAVAAALLAVVLAACTGLPTSGPVNVGRAQGEDAALPDFAFVPDGPAADATPEQIVDGFIAAGSGPRGNWQTAQEFLTSGFRSVWAPQAGVTVHEPGDLRITTVGEDEVVVAVRPVATVDRTGAYQVGGEGEISLRYRLEQEDGQWRIAEAPDGIVLDASRFGTVFRSYTLQYFDPTYTYLVPDTRWFPAPNAATRIAEALVSGAPTPWLADSVASSFHGDVALTQPAVPVRSGIAEVSLSAAARDLEQSTLDRMQTQLRESLVSAGILDVEMRVDGQVIDAERLSMRSTRVDARPLVLLKDGFGFLSGSELERVDGLSAQLEQIDAAMIEVDAEHTVAAVRTAAGSVLRVTADEVVEHDSRPGLTAPSVDRFGHIWTAQASEPSNVVTYASDGSARTLSGAWPGATRVQALRVSRDGTRVAALVRDGVRPAVWVAGIVRDLDGIPVALSDVRTVASLPGEGVALSWLDDATLALVWTDGQAHYMREQPLGGLGVDVRAPDDVVGVAGGNQSGTVRLRTADDALYVQRGSWQFVASGVRVLAVQQGTPR